MTGCVFSMDPDILSHHLLDPDPKQILLHTGLECPCESRYIFYSKVLPMILAFKGHFELV